MKRALIVVSLLVFAVVLGGCAGNRPPTAEIVGLKDGDRVQKDVSFQGKGTDPEGRAVTYEWDFGDGTKGTGESPAHTYAEAGKEYTVTLVVSDEGKAKSKPVKVKIYVNAPPVAVAEATPTSGKPPLTVEFDGSKSSDKEGAVAYSWDFNGDGTEDSTEAKGSFTYEQPGDYTATLTVTDADGATATATVEIKVEGEQAGQTHTVSMEFEGGRFYFEPEVLRISPGDTVVWVNISGGPHNSVAYHPSINNKALGIPEGAEPWESPLITATEGPEAQFEHTFTAEGTYAYYCFPHEAVGMVGLIIVGEPTPLSQAFIDSLAGEAKTVMEELVAEAEVPIQ